MCPRPQCLQDAGEPLWGTTLLSDHEIPFWKSSSMENLPPQSRNARRVPRITRGVRHGSFRNILLYLQMISVTELLCILFLSRTNYCEIFWGNIVPTKEFKKKYFHWEIIFHVIRPDVIQSNFLLWSSEESIDLERLQDWGLRLERF